MVLVDTSENTCDFPPPKGPATMRTTLMTTAIATGAVALALLTGCSGGGSEPSDDATLTWEDSPLSAYWEKIGGSQDEADAAAQMAKSEEIVAACMQEEGFEYTPQDTSGHEQVASTRPRATCPRGTPSSTRSSTGTAPRRRRTCR